MRLKCEYHYLFEELTDREKRQMMDRELQKRYPDRTPQQIHELREAHVQENWLVARRKMPQPEFRELPQTRVLTLEDVAACAAEHYAVPQKEKNTFVLSMTGAAILAAMVGCMAGIAGTVFLVTVMVLMTGHYLFRKGSADKKIRNAQKHIEAEECSLRGYTVGDMRTIWDDDGSCDYFIYLTEPGQDKPWRYLCQRSIYEQYREGDLVYVTFIPGEKEPCGFLLAEQWHPDEQVCRLIDRIA